MALLKKSVLQVKSANNIENVVFNHTIKDISTVVGTKTKTVSCPITSIDLYVKHGDQIVVVNIPMDVMKQIGKHVKANDMTTYSATDDDLLNY